MSWRNDRAPIGITCPIIDEAISIVEGISISEDESQRTIENAVSMMEQVREANLTLRNWGNELSREKDELYDEIENLKREVADLKFELSEQTESAKYWERRYDESQEEKEDIETKYYELQEAYDKIEN